MIAMLSPDLLDRRALALLRLVDVHGAAVRGPVVIQGEGVRTVAKGDGRFALLSALGFAAYEGSFDPIAPTAAKPVRLDLTPAAPDVMPRSVTLELPRPASASAQGSVFEPATIEMLPSPRAGRSRSACLVRVSVLRSGDGHVVENALVRARSDDGLFGARALTDARGEACLVFPILPLAFSGTSIRRDLPVRVTVQVKTGVAAFHAPGDVATAAAAAASRTQGHIDPDVLMASLGEPDFGSGAEVLVAAGREAAVRIEWKP
jgi:hypothetical protein